MARGYLLDTNVLVDRLRLPVGREPVPLSRLRGEKFCSVVTHAELWAGVRSGEEDTVADLLAALGSIDVDADIARTAGGFQQRYGRSHGVALADALIAATAVRHGLLLVTRDQRHYPMREVKLWSGLRPQS